LFLPTPSRLAGASYSGTALFVDLVDSTEILQRVGPQKYRRFFSQWTKEMDRLAVKLGGEVERTTGDGAFLVFTGDHGQGHAWNALEFGRQTSERLKRFRSELGVEPQCRVGLESGQITGSYVREGGRATWSSASPAVNLAKRLADEPVEGLVPFRIGPTAERLLSPEIKCRSVKSFVPKGFGQEHVVYAPNLD
jgi:class 3 adenylate cyclase